MVTLILCSDKRWSLFYFEVLGLHGMITAYHTSRDIDYACLEDLSTPNGTPISTQSKFTAKLYCTEVPSMSLMADPPGSICIARTSKAVPMHLLVGLHLSVAFGSTLYTEQDESCDTSFIAHHQSLLQSPNPQSAHLRLLLQTQ